MQMPFDISSLSKCDPHKSTCGDYCAYFDIPKEKQLLLVLADGVGSCVCDWKASKTACESFIAHYLENKQIDTISNRIIQSIQETNKTLLNEVGFCAGMKSTFVGLVWDYENGTIYYTGIGDSRIYAVEKETIQQITKDETKTVIRRGMDGKPLVYAGVVVVAEGLTNVLGALASCSVLDMPDKAVEGVVLASDGFYNCQNTFESDMHNVFNHLDMTAALEKVGRQYQDAQKDDMTVLIARKKTTTAHSTEDTVEQILADKRHTYSTYQIIHALFDQLSKSIALKRSDKCQNILGYCKTHDILFGKENIENLISQMFKLGFQDNTTYRQLVAMLGKS